MVLELKEDRYRQLRGRIRLSVLRVSQYIMRVKFLLYRYDWALCDQCEFIKIPILIILKHFKTFYVLCKPHGLVVVEV